MAELTPSESLALELSAGLQATPKNMARVAKMVGPETAAWAFGQWALRGRAADKFALASHMLFVREAMEQATHEFIARRKAARFPTDVLVVDATCGIGGELISLAARGEAHGYELDDERARYARHNLSVHQRSATVFESNGLAPTIFEGYAVADPARRSGGARTFDPSRFEPTPFAVTQAFTGAKQCALKLSPMLFDTTLDGLGPRVEFLSYGGECREATVWLGSEVEPWRGAWHLESDSWLPSGHSPSVILEPERYFFDADPAAIRAHALDAWGMEMLGDSPGYLTGASIIESPWLEPFQVMWTGKPEIKGIRAELAARGLGTPILKQRGTGFELQQLRRQLKMEGNEPGVVAFWSHQKKIRAAILKPVEKSP